VKIHRFDWFSRRKYTNTHDTIEEFTWTRKLSIQLYLAHVARKKKLKQTTAVPFNTVQVKNP